MLNKLEGLEYKVAYKKWIENESLIQISHELNFSLDHIKKKLVLELAKRMRREQINTFATLGNEK